jgi:DnaJ-class molecular chaperone
MNKRTKQEISESLMIEVSTECKHCQGTGDTYDSRFYTRASNCVECNGLGVIITIEQEED